LVEHYNRQITGRHLEVGVGTALLLHRCRIPGRGCEAQMTLLDVSPQALRFAARRLSPWQPRLLQHDVRNPMDTRMGTYDSIGCNYLLHCLPGTSQTRVAVLDYLLMQLNPGGVLFGSTILSRDVPCNWPARRLLRIYNQRAIFCNQADSPSWLRSALESRFVNVQVRVAGCVALFSAQVDPLA
jgi:2-polyprenyl-3-methyl-5-hydroxy-6-metoxy-1,4-benzoquinol methylase